MISPMSYPPQSIESDLIRAVAFFADQEKVMRGWPHTIFLYTTDAPKGIRDSLAILKHCFPIGMPRIVMHQRQPRMQYPIAISRPKKMLTVFFIRLILQLELFKM